VARRKGEPPLSESDIQLVLHCSHMLAMSEVEKLAGIIQLSVGRRSWSYVMVMVMVREMKTQLVMFSEELELVKGRTPRAGSWPPTGAARHPWTAPGTSRGRKSGTREGCSKGYKAGDKEAKRDLVRTWPTATGPDWDLAAEEHGMKDGRPGENWNCLEQTRKATSMRPT
jgi:hypothetical protein